MKTIKIKIQIASNGKESEDFAKILKRMYVEWAKRKLLKYEIDNDEIILQTEMDLSKEAGVHRLIRISPFDEQERRYTSFAAVNIEIDGKEIAIPKDIHNIRNYVLFPYTMAKDTRSKIEVENVLDVLNGGISLDKLMEI